MTTTFHNIEPDKQQRIIEVAMKHFAEDGYKDASTNKMVKEAGIGKGMLFYYFKTKYDLYIYLVDYGLDVMEQEFFNQVDLSEGDFIERMYQIAKQKMHVFKHHPHLMTFLQTVLLYSKENQPLPPELIARYDVLVKEGMQKMYQNIDVSYFKEQMDAEKAMRLIEWSIGGYQQTLTEQLKQQVLTDALIDQYWDDFYGYLAVLKQAYYK
ncbi:MAG: TetR/AcrR family transcriptional regulator [Bacillota bacterium]